MKGIELTALEVRAIIYALNRTPPSTGAEMGSTEVLGYTQWVPLSTRYLLSSKLRANFLRGGDLALGTSGSTIANLIITDVFNKFDRYGGGCGAYEGLAMCKAIVDPGPSSMMPKPSSVRAASVTNVCEKLVSINGAIDNMMINASMTSASMLNEENIQKLWNYMIPSRPLDSASKAKFTALATAVNTEKLATMEGWRFIALKMCQSPFYEVL